MSSEPLFERYLERTLTEEDAAQFRTRFAADAEFRKAFLGYVTDTALIIKVGSRLELSERPAAKLRGDLAARRPNLRWESARIPLAIAASLAIVAGAWWFSPRQADLELRVVEVQGSGFRVQGSGRERENTQHPTSNIQLSSGERITIGSTLRPGDGIEVGADGYARLAYADGSVVELHRSTRMRVEAAAGREKNAKRLALDVGMLGCSAAPQRNPLEIQTPHAVARVVGTRFSLGVTEAESRLGVQEGKVELCQGDKILEVTAGKAVIATASGMKMARAVLYAWGDNQFGQLGDGTKTNRAYPTPVAGIDGVMAVSGGGDYTVALKSDRTVWTWGGNSSGQLGDGTMNQRSYPAAVAGLSDVTAIAAGGSHTLALKADGGVWAWGDNSRGQLGNGTTNNSPIPVPVTLPDGRPLTGVMALAAGSVHSVALRNDGSVWTWGLEVGDGTNVTRRLNPVLVKLADGLPLSGVRAIAAGNGYTVALKSDGTLWTWGRNENGQLGDGTTISRLNPTTVKAAVGAPFIAIAAGSYHTVAVRADATVWAWGSNNDGVLGGGTFHNPTTTQVRLSDGSALSNVTAVAAGSSHTLALKTDGTLVAWGKYPDTLGGRVLHPMPVKLADGTILSKVIAIAAGARHSVAIGEE